MHSGNGEQAVCAKHIWNSHVVLLGKPAYKAATGRLSTASRLFGLHTEQPTSDFWDWPTLHCGHVQEGHQECAGAAIVQEEVEERGKGKVVGVSFSNAKVSSVYGRPQPGFIASLSHGAHCTAAGSVCVRDHILWH